MYVVAPSGTSVCVCDPHFVDTNATCFGFLGSEKSTTRTPSSPVDLSASLKPMAFVLLQRGSSFPLELGVSTETNTNFPEKEMSPWLLGQLWKPICFR